MAQSSLSNRDELRLVSSVAKTEVASSANLDTLKQELFEAIANLPRISKSTSSELFVILLLLHCSK